jgi:PBSX family phage terminase large subunit
MVNTLRNEAKATGASHVHTYAPRGGCKEVMEARGEEVLISGPAGTGKSRACLEKIYTVCLLTPNTRALILRKTLRSLGSTALVTWRNYVVKEALETGDVVYYGGSSQEPPQYRFRNGSTVTIGGLDNPTRIMSSEYDIVYVQEATEITIDDLEFIKTRLRNWKTSFQQLVMDCNPAGDKHWLKLRANDKRTKLIESRHEDNPRLFKEDGTITDQGAAYMSILDNLTGVRYKRLRLGLWVSADGIIYEEFDPHYHVLQWDLDEEGNRLPLPYEWTRYWVIDFGYVHPFVLKCYAEDPEDGALIVYREIYMTQRTVAEHAATIMNEVTRVRKDEWYDHFNGVIRTKETVEWIEPQPTAIICDHDAEGRATFERETGLGTQAAVKNVYEGINAHKERLKGNKFYYMEDVLVERDQSQVDKLLPASSVEEYSSYVWKVSPDGRIQDQPVKRDDDGVDTDRYMTSWKDLKGNARVTQLG